MNRIQIIIRCGKNPYMGNAYGKMHTEKCIRKNAYGKMHTEKSVPENPDREIRTGKIRTGKMHTGKSGQEIINYRG